MYTDTCWVNVLKRGKKELRGSAAVLAFDIIDFVLDLRILAIREGKSFDLCPRLSIFFRRRTALASGSATMPPSVARELGALLSHGFRPESEPDGDVRPVHCLLRESSPSTLLLAERRRRGLLRGIGDIAPALLRMQKFGLVHEAVCSGPLTEAERADLVASLQTATRESRKLVAAARRRTKQFQPPREVYRPRSALVVEAPLATVTVGGPPTPDADARLEAELHRLRIADSLMSAVRAWRRSSLLMDTCGTPQTIYSMTTASSDKNDTDDECSLTGTDLPFLELADDKTLRLGRAREGITKL